MTKQHFSITVIIPTLARSKSVRRLLDSVAKQTRLPEQIIFVDASEDHDTEAVISQADTMLQDRLEYYRAERGLTRQRNFGLQKARGEIIGFFDDDVVLDETYLDEIAKPFESDSENQIGGATGFVYPKQVKVSVLRKAFLNLVNLISGPRCLAKHYDIQLIPKEPFVQCIPIRYVSGCNMFFRREVYDRYRFNEWFEGYGLGEDREFGLRVSRHWGIVAVGTARLDHLSEPAGRPNYTKLGKMFVENPARILTIARRDQVVFHEIFLIGRQFLGVLICSFGFCLSGQWSAGISYTYGGMQGVINACRFIDQNVMAYYKTDSND